MATVSADEVGRQGRARYATLRARVETPENLGKEIVIDVTTGDYEIDDDGRLAAQRLRLRHPGAEMYGLRIGYNAVYALGGSVERTER